MSGLEELQRVAVGNGWVKLRPAYMETALGWESWWARQQIPRYDLRLALYEIGVWGAWSHET